MEYVEGGSLAQQVRKDGPLYWRVAAAVVLASGTMAVAGGLLVKRGRPSAPVATPPAVTTAPALAPARTAYAR